ncbi:MAG: 30S ribosomal protein S3 [Minisyncoccia bacterium]
MGKKISSYGLRLGINEYWKSRWYFSKKFRVYLEADYIIRKTIEEMFPKSGIVDVIIERKSPENSRVIIKTAKPGVLIGREGQRLKNLQEKIDERLSILFKKHKLEKPTLEVIVEEVRKPTACASYLAQLAAIDIEKNKSVRGVIKKIIEKAKQNKNILGIKVRVSGRLGGANIHRSENITWGRLPLSKLKAKIDFAKETALCKYGKIGIKVWLYKGDSEEIEE